MKNQSANELIAPANIDTKFENESLASTLAVLVHAIRCSLASCDAISECLQARCIATRAALTHIRECDSADACTSPHCASTLAALKHFHGCTRPSCTCAGLCPGVSRAPIAAFVRELLLRNQYLLWRKKIVPFRPVLVDRVSDKLLSLLASSRAPPSSPALLASIRHQLTLFEDSNFRKSRGISTYLTNFSKYSVELLVKTRADRRVSSANDQLDEELDIGVFGQSIYAFLRKYSTDVLHDRVKWERKSIWTKAQLRSVFGPVHSEVIREKKADCCGPGDASSGENAAGEESDRLAASFWGDLAAIGDKLMGGNEYGDPWDIVSDYWAVFEKWGGVGVATCASTAPANADSKGSRERNSKRVVSRVARLFGELADRAMRSQGLCCGRLLEYAPLSLICCVYQCSLLINRDETCYRYIPSDTSPGTDAPQIVCCDSCFHSNPQKDTLDITMATDDSETDTNSNPTIESVEKRLFEKQTNNVREREEMIECLNCHRKWHRVCAGHLDEIWPCGFYCPRCESSRPYREEAHPVNPLTSSRLPHTPLSQHIETRIDQWRKAQTQPVPVITIRILSSRQKLIQIKPEMKRAYVETGELPETLPYEQVSLFAFQKTSDPNDKKFNKSSEICLFGMQCQQFSSDCPQPNRQRVYLAYLDSVQYFQPALLRTEFYHRLLIAYFEFCSLQGFLYAHIWACPPADGDEYIFHCHPPQQKLPKPKRLQEWYVAMLDKAIQEGIIYDYCDIFSYAFNSKLMSVSELPYFEGDYWPNALEELLQEIAGESSNLDTYPVSKKRKKIKKVPSKVASKRRRQSDQSIDNSNEESCSSEETILMTRLFDLLERRKDNFLVVRLSNNNSVSDEPQSTPSSSETTETSLSQMGELMDGRDRFLSLCREKRLEFSSERRARFATLSLCYELHLELNGGVLYSCNRCHRLLIDEERYTCLSPECVEFELCVTCSQVPRSHPHQLTRVSPHDTLVNPPDLPNQSDQSVAQSNIQSVQSSPSNAQSVSSNCQSTNQNAIENKRQQLAAAVRMLQHSFSCRDAECRITNCLDWKKHLTHMSQCRLGQNCGLCQRLERLCALHVKLCRDTSCAVPSCVRNRRLTVQSRLLHATSERRRIENENNDGVRRLATPCQPNGTQFQQFPSNSQIYIIQNRTNPNQNPQLLCVPRNNAQYHQTYRSFPPDSTNTNSSVTYLYKHPNVIANSNPNSFSTVDSVPNSFYFYNNNNISNSTNVCPDMKVIPNFNQNICYNTGNVIHNYSNIAYANNKLLNANVDYNGFSNNANMMQINANNVANTINAVRYNGNGTTATSSSNTQRYVVSNAGAARTTNPSGHNNNFVTRIINTSSNSQRSPNISVGNDNYSNRNVANTFANNSGIVYMNNVNIHHGNVNIPSDSDNTNQRYAVTSFSDGNNVPLKIINGHNIGQRNGAHVSISGDTHSSNTH